VIFASDGAGFRLQPCASLNSVSDRYDEINYLYFLPDIAIIRIS
jgi:hypothetical protein